MNIRQKFLATIYPATQVLARLTGMKNSFRSSTAKANVPFHDLVFFATNGESISASVFRGKKVLLVNTASDCGYTRQYESLQKLHTKYQNELVVIAFPSNDFKGQEPTNDQQILAFCRVNYGVTFPLMAKSIVTKIPGQSKVFQWLTTKELNGWNDVEPVWNFCKYLVDEEGNLSHTFESGVDPLSPRIITAIEHN